MKSVITRKTSTSEDLRKRLPACAEEVCSGGVGIAFGTNPAHPVYVLAPLGDIPSDRRKEGIRITADAARKAWTDLRAAVRLLDFIFILTTDGVERAAIARHPDSSKSKTRMDRWLAKRGQQPAPVAEETLEARLSHLETAVAKLQRNTSINAKRESHHA